MDAEIRLLLYAVVLGAGVGLVSILRRGALSTLRVHAGVLAGLLTASLASVLAPRLGEVIATPVIGAFLLLAIAPSILIVGGRRCARGRHFVAAGGLLWTGAALLGLPAPIRREAQFYGALAASDRGDAPRAQERMRRLVTNGGIPAVHGGRTLAEALPLAGARRWNDALAVLDAMPSSATPVLAIEARAAAETGDLRRALRACQMLRARSDGGGARESAVRAVLAAAGRTATLAEAAASRWPLLRGPRGVVRLTQARAHEARGELDIARDLYADATRRAPAVVRRDAAAGRERVLRGEARRAEPDELELDEILRLEAACRAEAREAARPARPAWATWAATLLTALVSIAVILGPGIDGFSLLVVGALSAPLVENDGQWWRLFTAMLLHGGWWHLILNLGCIVPVGVLVERRVGAARTLVIYLGSGLIGSAASVYINATDVGVGASGAAMGLIGALLALLLRRPALFSKMERKRWLSMLWIGVVATGVIGLLEHEYVDNAAHGAGLVGGLLLALCILPEPSGVEPRLRRAAARLSAALLVALMAVAMVEARGESELWTKTRDVRARGAAVELPGWLKTTPLQDGSVRAERRPAEIAILVGAEPYASPRPQRLVPDIGALRDLFLAADVPSVLEGDQYVIPVQPADLEAGLNLEWSSGVRFFVIRSGRAFALVRLPDDPVVESAYAGLLNRLRATLREDPPDNAERDAREIDDDGDSSE